MQNIISRWLVSYLSKEVDRPDEVSGLGHDWHDVVQPGDVLLVEGRTRVSTAIKYLTQSTWSHAALIISDETVLEADMHHGVITSPLSKYQHHNARICRPIGLTPEDLDVMLNFARSQIGVSYDMKNIVDLARYLLPTPPVPAKFRRQMLTLGSGDPTEKIICSVLIARAFQHVRYPILPIQWWSDDGDIVSQVRHHSVFVPRDFDLSPYFEIVKPTVAKGFTYQTMVWSENAADGRQP